MGQIRSLVMFSALVGVGGVLSACAPQASAPVVSGYGQKRTVVSSSVQSRVDVVNPVRKDAVFANVAKQASSVAVHAKPAVKVKAVEVQSVESAPKLVKHEVLATDTAYKLARTYNTSVEQILKDNGLSSVADVREGQTLTIAFNSKPQVSAWDDMKRVLREPVVQRDPKTNELLAVDKPVETKVLDIAKVDSANIPPKLLADIEPAAGERPVKTAEGVNYVTHKVEPKETIYRISLKYNVSVLDIMAANDFEQPQDLKADAVIRVPVKQPMVQHLMAKHDVLNVAPAAGVVEADASAADKPVEVAMLPVTPAVDKQQAIQEAVLTVSKKEKSDEKSVERMAEAKRGQVDPIAARAKGLVWPVKGEILRKFGDDGSGVARTGINIAVPKGTAVLASEGGKVLYADDGLKIYGKLVLVRHDNGMVSAYAHNSYLLVKKNETVKKGQIIALSGATGNVESPQLHFELRQHASAIDPLAMLPKL